MKNENESLNNKLLELERNKHEKVLLEQSLKEYQMQQQKTTSQLQEKILQLEKATQPKEHFRISQLEREIKNYKNEIDNYKILLSQFDFIKRENYNLKSEVQKKSQVKFILEL